MPGSDSSGVSDDLNVVSASGWQSGISSDVRLAAMTPAIRATPEHVALLHFGVDDRGKRRRLHPDRPGRPGATLRSPAWPRRRPSAPRRIGPTWERLRRLIGIERRQIRRQQSTRSAAADSRCRYACSFASSTACDRLGRAQRARGRRPRLGGCRARSCSSDRERVERVAELSARAARTLAQRDAHLGAAVRRRRRLERSSPPARAPPPMLRARRAGPARRRASRTTSSDGVAAEVEAASRRSGPRETRRTSASGRSARRGSTTTRDRIVGSSAPGSLDVRMIVVSAGGSSSSLRNAFAA